jgi:hypothetical protein
MWMRQCTECGAIDPRRSYPDQLDADRDDPDWHCIECGAKDHEAIVMPPVERTR